MNDKFGNELKVNDTVYYVHMYGRASADASRCKIVGFTEKMVRLEKESPEKYSNDLAKPSSLIKQHGLDADQIKKKPLD